MAHKANIALVKLDPPNPSDKRPGAWKAEFEIAYLDSAFTVVVTLPPATRDEAIVQAARARLHEVLLASLEEAKPWAPG